MDMTHSKRMKTNVSNHNNFFNSQMPDLIKDAYFFDENSTEVNESTVSLLKE